MLRTELHQFVVDVTRRLGLTALEEHHRQACSKALHPPVLSELRVQRHGLVRSPSRRQDLRDLAGVRGAGLGLLTEFGRGGPEPVEAPPGLHEVPLPPPFPPPPPEPPAVQVALAEARAQCPHLLE